MIVIVTGGRGYGFDTSGCMDPPSVRAASQERARREVEHINRVLGELNPSMVVQGAASGADLLADTWANDNRVPCLAWPAQWGKHGKAAGPIRNREMLEWAYYHEQSDGLLLVAFPGGKGTANCVKTARELFIDVRDERGE